MDQVYGVSMVAVANDRTSSQYSTRDFLDLHSVKNVSI